MPSTPAAARTTTRASRPTGRQHVVRGRRVWPRPRGGGLSLEGILRTATGVIAVVGSAYALGQVSLWLQIHHAFGLSWSGSWHASALASRALVGLSAVLVVLLAAAVAVAAAAAVWGGQLLYDALGVVASAVRRKNLRVCPPELRGVAKQHMHVTEMYKLETCKDRKRPLTVSLAAIALLAFGYFYGVAGAGLLASLLAALGTLLALVAGWLWWEQASTEPRLIGSVVAGILLAGVLACFGGLCVAYGVMGEREPLFPVVDVLLAPSEAGDGPGVLRGRLIGHADGYWHIYVAGAPGGDGKAGLLALPDGGTAGVWLVEDDAPGAGGARPSASATASSGS